MEWGDSSYGLLSLDSASTKWKVRLWPGQSLETQAHCILPQQSPPWTYETAAHCKGSANMTTEGGLEMLWFKTADSHLPLELTCTLRPLTSWGRLPQV